jgi:hypothetical protein
MRKGVKPITIFFIVKNYNKKYTLQIQITHYTLHITNYKYKYQDKTFIFANAYFITHQNI